MAVTQGVQESGERRWPGVALTGGVLALIALGYALQLAGLLLPAAALTVLGAVSGAALDVLLLRLPVLARRLGRSQLTTPVRALLRDALTLGGLLRLGVLEPPGAGVGLVVALLVCWATHFVCQAISGTVRKQRRLPVVTRNVETSGLGLSPAPPALFARWGTLRLTGVELLVTAGFVLTAGTGVAVWGAVAAGVCAVGLSAGTAHLASWLGSGKRRVSDVRVMEWLDQWLAEYRPTVGMYFSGGTSSAYQANMWLSTLESLDGRPLIVLRERFMVQKIEVTDVPIVCIPKVADLMHLEHSTLRVLLHPANSGKTSQILRIPTIKHAFTNHGESDKLSSCNPYAKAYDQVWVAGPAARERYQLAEVGVDDADVVEVGRPQLAPIERAAGPLARGVEGWVTVLYAPTWEGWDGNPGNTSVIEAGENIVAALLADERVRLVYKPHPMTGSVDARAGAADARMRGMIQRANAQRQVASVAPQAQRELVAARERWEGLGEQLVRSGADEMERMRGQSAPQVGRAARVGEALEAWQEAFWASLPVGEHQIITGPRPGLYSCFNQADVLISDVSSVVSDYLSSEKPYAVANTSGMSREAFVELFPTVRAGTILTPDAREVPHLLASVRDPAQDTLAEARTHLKTHLLGPSDPPSLTRFQHAVHALTTEAQARNARRRAAEATDWEAAEAQERAEMSLPQLAEALGDDAEL